MSKWAGHGANEKTHGGDFWSSGEEGGDRGWCAFINIRCPHMKGHSRDFEGKACNDKDQSKDDAEA